jgi:hypothetical protein
MIDESLVLNPDWERFQPPLRHDPRPDRWMVGRGRLLFPHPGAATDK